jgi:hypothetical protein
LHATAATPRFSAAAATPGITGSLLVEVRAFEGAAFAFCEDEARGGRRCGAECGAAFVEGRDVD